MRETGSENRSGRLHLRHRKASRASATRASGQTPGTGDRVALADRTIELQCIARRTARLHGHAERTAHLPVEIPAQREGTAFGFAGSEAR